MHYFQLLQAILCMYIQMYHCKPNSDSKAIYNSFLQAFSHLSFLEAERDLLIFFLINTESYKNFQVQKKNKQRPMLYIFSRHYSTLFNANECYLNLWS